MFLDSNTSEYQICNQVHIMSQYATFIHIPVACIYTVYTNVENGTQY